MKEIGRIHSDDLVVVMTQDAQDEVIVTLQRIIHNDSSDGLNLISIITVDEIKYSLEK